jgi:hypothetical protein
MGPGLRKPVRYMRVSVLCEADIGEFYCTSYFIFWLWRSSLAVSLNLSGRVSPNGESHNTSVPDESRRMARSTISSIQYQPMPIPSFLTVWRGFPTSRLITSIHGDFAVCSGKVVFWFQKLRMTGNDMVWSPTRGPANPIFTSMDRYLLLHSLLVAFP